MLLGVFLILSILGILLTGLTKRFSSIRRAFVTYGLILTIAVSFLISFFGEKWAIAQQETFYENLNLFATAAHNNTQPCTLNGSCYWTFECHQSITYGPDETCDSNGNNCQPNKHEYHDNCPVADAETRLGLDAPYAKTKVYISFGEHRLPDNPWAHRWIDPSTGTIPADNNLSQQMIDTAGSGIPPEFTAANRSITNHIPFPVVARESYINYIEADKDSLQNYQSNNIAIFQAKHLLPKLPSDVNNYYYYQKFFSTPGVAVDTNVWNNAMLQFDSTLGMHNQGDLFIVAVKNTDVPNLSDYGNALMAYWTHREYMGDNTLGKNGIVVIVAIDSTGIIRDCNAYTMIKNGNAAMLADIQLALLNKPLDPTTLLGSPQVTMGLANAGGLPVPQIAEGTPPGILEAITIWGSDQFVRFHTTNKHGTPGFVSLEADVQPTLADKIGAGIIGFILFCILWFASLGIRSYCFGLIGKE